MHFALITLSQKKSHNNNANVTYNKTLGSDDFNRNLLLSSSSCVFCVSSRTNRPVSKEIRRWRIETSRFLSLTAASGTLESAAADDVCIWLSSSSESILCFLSFFFFSAFGVSVALDSSVERWNRTKTCRWGGENSIFENFTLATGGVALTS